MPQQLVPIFLGKFAALVLILGFKRYTNCAELENPLYGFPRELYLLST